MKKTHTDNIKLHIKTWKTTVHHPKKEKKIIGDKKQIYKNSDYFRHTILKFNSKNLFFVFSLIIKHI